jgi:hypothetical protein
MSLVKRRLVSVTSAGMAGKNDVCTLLCLSGPLDWTVCRNYAFKRHLYMALYSEVKKRKAGLANVVIL